MIRPSSACVTFPSDRSDLEVVVDLAELATHGLADEYDGGDGDDRDECDEQGVLHHAGTFFITDEPALEGRHQTKHADLLGRAR